MLERVCPGAGSSRISEEVMSGEQFSLKHDRAIRPAISNQDLFSATNQFAVNSRIGLIKAEGLQRTCVAEQGKACGVAVLENDRRGLVCVSRAWVLLCQLAR